MVAILVSDVLQGIAWNDSAGRTLAGAKIRSLLDPRCMELGVLLVPSLVFFSACKVDYFFLVVVVRSSATSNSLKIKK